MQPIVPRMNDVQARAWVALVGTAELLPHALDAQLTADAGLINFEYGILSILTLAPDRTLRMGELAKAVDSPLPRLSKAVTRLEKRGLVERVSSHGDGRAVSVHLTRDGRRAWLKATPPHIELARDTLLADYDNDQLIQLAQLLEPLLRRLDPEAALGRIPFARQ
jgi:DNA-binding MarR family transcriptional regulator